MSRFYSTISVGVFLSIVGCAAGVPSTDTLYTQETSNGYCHKKLRPVGSTDPARPTQDTWGDYIDYYGPCDGPTAKEMAEQQRRFEQFRFGRDFMDEG
jgi:hypothetical protein